MHTWCASHQLCLMALAPLWSSFSPLPSQSFQCTRSSNSPSAWLPRAWHSLLPLPDSALSGQLLIPQVFTQIVAQINTYRGPLLLISTTAPCGCSVEGSSHCHYFTIYCSLPCRLVMQRWGVCPT